MKIDKVFETPEGAVRFQGEFNPEEVSFMTEWFINTMMHKGAIPFVAGEKASQFVPMQTDQLS